MRNGHRDMAGRVWGLGNGLGDTGLGQGCTQEDTGNGHGDMARSGGTTKDTGTWWGDIGWHRDTVGPAWGCGREDTGTQLGTQGHGREGKGRWQGMGTQRGGVGDTEDRHGAVSRRTWGHRERAWGHGQEGVGTRRAQGHGGGTWEGTGTRWDQRGDVAGGHRHTERWARGRRDMAGRAWGHGWQWGHTGTGTGTQRRGARRTGLGTRRGGRWGHGVPSGSPPQPR